jgi:hypothetical protein
MRQRFADEDVNGSGQPGSLGHQEAYGSRAKYRDPRRKPEMAKIHGVDRHTKGLNQRTFAKAQGIGERDTIMRRHGYIFAEAPFLRRAAGKPHLRTEILVPLLARGASATGQGRLHDHPCSRRQPRCLGIGGHDYGRKFVAQNKGV